MRFGINGQIKEPYQAIISCRFAKADLISLRGIEISTSWHVEKTPRLTCSLLSVQQIITAQMRCFLIWACRVLLERNVHTDNAL